MSTRKRIYCPNDKVVMRIIPSLAEEIGLDESIVFLQMEFLTGSSVYFKDGRYWIFASLRDLQSEYFSFWSYSKVGRIIEHLSSDLNLILINNFNKRESDKTNWYAIHYEMVSALNSIVVIDQSDDVSKRKLVFQKDPKKVIISQDLFQNETANRKNETALHKTYEDLSKNQKEIDRFFDHHKKNLQSKKQNELLQSFFQIEQLGQALKWNTAEYDKLIYWKSKHKFWSGVTDTAHYLLKALQNVALADIPVTVKTLDDELMERIR